MHPGDQCLGHYGSSLFDCTDGYCIRVEAFRSKSRNIVRSSRQDQRIEPPAEPRPHSSHSRSQKCKAQIHFGSYKVAILAFLSSLHSTTHPSEFEPTMSNSTQPETSIPAFEHWVSNNDTLPVPRPPTPVRPSTYAQDLAAIFGLALLVGMIAGVLGNIIQLLYPCRFLMHCLDGALLGSALIITFHPIGLFNNLRTQHPFLNTNRSFLSLMPLLCKPQNYDNDMNHFSSNINDTRLSLSIKVREAWYARGKGPDVINGVDLADWYKWFEQCEDTLCHLIWTAYSRQGIFALWARDADIIKLREHAEKLRWLGGEVLSRLRQRAEAQRKLEEAAEWEEAKVQAACKMAVSQEGQRVLAQWRAGRDEYRLRTMAAKAKVWQGSAAIAQEKARIRAKLNVNQEDAEIPPQRKAVAEWLNAWEAKRGAQEAAIWAAAKDEAARSIAARKPFGELPPLEAQILDQQQEATEWAQAKADAVQNLATKEVAGVLNREARDAQVLLKKQKEAALRWQDAADWAVAVAKADAARKLAASEKTEKQRQLLKEQEAQRQKEASLRWQEAARKLVASDKTAEVQAQANAKAEHERRLKFREQVEVLRKVEVAQRWAQYAEAEQKKAEQEDAARLLAEKVEAAEEMERDMKEYVCI